MDFKTYITIQNYSQNKQTEHAHNMLHDYFIKCAALEKYNTYKQYYKYNRITITLPRIDITIEINLRDKKPNQNYK